MKAGLILLCLPVLSEGREFPSFDPFLLPVGIHIPSPVSLRSRISVVLLSMSFSLGPPCQASGLYRQQFVLNTHQNCISPTQHLLIASCQLSDPKLCISNMVTVHFPVPPPLSRSWHSPGVPKSWVNACIMNGIASRETQVFVSPSRMPHDCTRYRSRRQGSSNATESRDLAVIVYVLFHNLCKFGILGHALVVLLFLLRVRFHSRLHCIS